MITFDFVCLFLCFWRLRTRVHPSGTSLFPEEVAVTTGQSRLRSSLTTTSRDPGYRLCPVSLQGPFCLLRDRNRDSATIVYGGVTFNLFTKGCVPLVSNHRNYPSKKEVIV